ncbi:MAG: hypothetical protein IJ055_09050 [Oscillospiraceae bacterium]|nr:hypothetical protein [Oscillospiraceae bacterium]
MAEFRGVERQTEIDVAVPDPEADRRRLDRRLMHFHVLTLLAVITVLTGFMLFGKRPTESTEENRSLAKAPKFSISSYLDGSFTSEFAQFFNDTVPMRSTFKGFISDFRASLGVPYDGDVVLVGRPPTEVQVTAEQPETQPAAQSVAIETQAPTQDEHAETQAAPLAASVAVPTEAPTEAPTMEDLEDADGEIANNILVVKDRGIMLYGGNLARGEEYAQTLNEYKAALGSDVHVYSLVAPTAVSFYLPKKYASSSASETENIDHINSFLQDVTPVDAYNALLPHAAEAIYSRTDHHWQPLGAYYAAESFAEAAGVPFPPLSEYETVVKEGYVGTLYGYTNVAALKNNPEDFTYYVPQNDYTTTYYDIDMTNEREASLLLNLDNVAPSSWYLVFMGGDERITHVTTDCRNGRVLAIIKDSYGNALVPCLTSSFEEIWVIDMRYFKPNAVTFLQEHGVTDLLFAMNTFSATGGNSAKLRTIKDQ